MAQTQHPTTEPEQMETDTMAVFADNPQDPTSNLVLVGRIEVPRYDQPDSDGELLDTGTRLEVAVHRAIQSEDTSFPAGHIPVEEQMELVDGQEFMVMTDIEEPMSFAQFDMEQDFDHIWNPNE
jgi:hypothetical protein